MSKNENSATLNPTLRNTLVLTTSAMLVALGMIVGYFKIPISNIVELRLGTLPIAIGGMLFGPAVGGVIGAAVDIVGFIAKPTGAYFPGFTISAAMSGIVFGFILHKKTTPVRIAAACILNAIISSMLINTLNLSILYGMPFAATMLTRIPSSLMHALAYFIIISVIQKPLKSLPFFK